jgi:beta-1,4-N-acetylglucosaminyltransferase
MSVEGKQRYSKLCFVTIGATASFDSLIRACFHPDFLSSLSKAGYTDLLLQYGKKGRPMFEDLQRNNKDLKTSGLSCTGFGLNPDGLGREMLAAKGEDASSEGVVISHAGE